MNTKSTAVQETGSRLDGLKWFVALSLVAAGVYGNHFYAAEPLLYRVLALVGIGLLAIGVALQTAKGRAFSVLLRESRIEIRKVVWPTRPETTQTTLVVLAVVVLTSIFLWGVDSLLSWIIASLIA